MKTYAAYYDNKIRKDSSSGGIFSLLALQFDIIYGVAMTEDCYGAEFVRVENDIASLRGSKYLQAKVGDIFKQVKKDLEEGKQVLFSGTGCQVNGLRMFLQKDYHNLFLLDVICHGTPSSKLWREYVAYQESKFGKLERVKFRCKDNSLSDFCMKENQLYISKNRDPYMRMFLRDYCLRPSCYKCHAKKNKKSDITIADFWGIENVVPEMNDGWGTSLVITRTEKGQELFDAIKIELKWKEVCYEDAVRSNPSEYSSPIRPKERNTFFYDLSSLSFEEMGKKYAADREGSFLKKVVRKAKSLRKNVLIREKHTEEKQRSNADYGILFSFFQENKES